MNRAPAVACALALLVATACSGDSDPGVADPPREAATGVPADAELVVEPTAIGSAATSVPEEDVRRYYHMGCVDDLLTIVTTREIVYAELPCDRALPVDVAARFLGASVRVRVAPTEPAKLYLESDTAGSVEFTVGRVWVEAR